MADAKAAGTETTRRGALAWLLGAWGLFGGACAVGAGAMGRFLFPNVSFDPPQTFKAGYTSDFEVGKVDERFKAKYGVWIVRNDEEIYVLSTTCTHLGCQPNYLEAEAKIKCPCHGSGFKPTGINFEGPAPRPLERFRIVLAEDGQILVDKTKKFQYELGQWDQPEAFLKV
ncbi:MAG: ubiquinol-cytochrome c reductase iron-sulfur subunit [Planctomycetales bacterium]|nr:ubiquinol-cytochrome c reductase iron-sulfur subunit [Planctomycetales bacterium]